MHKSHLQRASAMAETEMEDRVASWHSRAVKAREFMDYLVSGSESPFSSLLGVPPHGPLLHLGFRVHLRLE